MSTSPGFDTLPLAPALLAGLEEMGFRRMTPVQASALPHVLAGRDVLARARTGSGKTAAFGLGLLNRLEPGSSRVQALVLCPTRELADQVAREIRLLARRIPNVKVLGLCGGMPLGPQIGSLQHSAQVVVGTPGRVLKPLRQGTLRLHGLRSFVLDEADRMLDMGFAEEIDELISHVPVRRQTLLFSATYPRAIDGISRRVQHDPVHVDVTADEPPPAIAQHWCAVSPTGRDDALLSALHGWGGALNLVFCNTRVDCASVASRLQDQGISAVALHGDLDQAERAQMLVRFSNRSATVLVATDVAARGLDIQGVDAVFNYELPAQPTVYVHRIGRTGRADRQGVAVSLVSDRERPRLAAIEAQLPDQEIRLCPLSEARQAELLSARVTTLEINGGRRSKLRPGDLLGALTAGNSIPGSAVGKIDLFDQTSYVAVDDVHVGRALRLLNGQKIKGKQFRARALTLGTSFDRQTR